MAKKKISYSSMRNSEQKELVTEDRLSQERCNKCDCLMIWDKEKLVCLKCEVYKEGEGDY